jgi:CheY-like chemotaxis protein
MYDHKTRILYVEDSLADINLFKEFIDDKVELTVVSDGQSAKSYLHRLKQTKSHFPNLIILDINLPEISGFELLNLIKKEQRLKFIPTVMFSSSDNQSDIKDAFSQAANGYVVKPGDLGDYSRAIETFMNYWVYTCKLPQEQ